MPDFVVKTLAVVVLLGGLIFVHELGHYLVAKLLGVKVIRFSIGFGPRLLGVRWGETDYCLSALPLGGYVKMAGDDPTAEVAPEDRGRGFLEQKPWRRLLIAAAGPLFNLLLPFLLIFGIEVGQLGEPTAAAVLGTVFAGSPAEKAGLRPDDRIVSVAAPGRPAQQMRQFGDLQEVVTTHPGETLVMEIEREGKLVTLDVLVGADERSNGIETVRVGVLRVSPYYAPSRVVPAAPGAAGPLEPFDLVISAGGAPVEEHGGPLPRPGGGRLWAHRPGSAPRAAAPAPGGRAGRLLPRAAGRRPHLPGREADAPPGRSRTSRPPSPRWCRAGRPSRPGCGAATWSPRSTASRSAPSPSWPGWWRASSPPAAPGPSPWPTGGPWT